MTVAGTVSFKLISF